MCLNDCPEYPDELKLPSGFGPVARLMFPDATTLGKCRHQLAAHPAMPHGVRQAQRMNRTTTRKP